MVLNTSLIGVIVAGIVALIGLLVVVLSVRLVRRGDSNDRMQEFVMEYGTASRLTGGMQTIEEEYTESLFKRTVVRGLRQIMSFFGRLTPQAAIQNLSKKLYIAGNPLGMRALEFNGMRLILVLVGVILAIFFNLRQQGMNTLVGGAAIIVATVLLPIVWLNGKVRVNQDEIRRGLPDALDMLSVCTFAGLGFDQSLQRVSEYWQTPLGLEFGRVVQEMELGVSRAEALRNMSERLEVAELSSFVAIIIQSENLGMRIADVLHAQAEQMRILRQYRAKEVANRLPAKMMVPLALLILPALLAVIFAPMAPSLLFLFG